MPRPQRKIPWLDQRNGVWYVFWYNPEKGRTDKLSLRTSDDSEAQDRYVQFLSEGRDVFRGSTSTSLSVAAALDQYLEEHDCAAIERQQYAAVHLKEFWSDTPVSSLDIPASRRYLKWRREEGPKKKPAAATTVRRELGVLMAAANHAVRWKRLGREELPTLEMPGTSEAKEVGFYTKDEIRRIFTAAEGPVKAFCVLAYFTGSRRKAIERLTVDQIDIKARRIRLTPVGKRKTKKRAPVVPINPAMAQVIKPMLLATSTEYLFQYSGFDVYKRYRLLCKKLGFAEDRRHPHMLRHSRATHMLQDGATIWKVASQLGDTVKTVESTYGHHSPEYLDSQGLYDEVADALN